MTAVASPISLDTYRDGGSVSVSFLDTQGIQHTLFFPAHLDVVESRKVTLIGYLPPRLERYILTSRISPITGLESVDSTMETESLSWDEARGILSQLSPLMYRLDTSYAYVFPKMIEIAANNGRVSEGA